MQTVVTHSGSFDPDDVLAVATLQLYLGVEKVRVIRTRRPEVIATGDWVVDVGGVYDPANKRYDHHQNGVPKRTNGVPYSAFGLIWLECGAAVAGSQEIADQIEQKLVQPIDAADNHVAVCHPGVAGLTSFEFFDVIDAFRPVWGSAETYDQQFVVALEFARGLLLRLIAQARARLDMQTMIRERYTIEQERFVLEFDKAVPRHALVTHEDVRVVVSPVPAEDVDHWMAAVVPVAERSFQNRAIFPEEWAGLAAEELVEVSGIDGAVFCHKERYIFVAETKEAALKAAHHARP